MNLFFFDAFWHHTLSCFGQKILRGSMFLQGVAYSIILGKLLLHFSREIFCCGELFPNISGMDMCIVGPVVMSHYLTK